MSTVPNPWAGKTGPPVQDADPYRYGWRYVRVVAPDGTETIEQVPLTLDDLLFPEEDDFIVQTQGHVNDMLYLKAVFDARLADAEAAVIADGRVDWNLPRVRPLGPDVAVFFGVKRQTDWHTFNVAAERARPKVVVEIVSENTRKNDLGIKRRFYYQAKVPLYVIADLVKPSRTRRLKLLAFRHTPQGFQPVTPDEQGRILLEALGMWIGVTRDRRGGYDRLACFDAKTGEELGDYAAVEKARAKAEAAAQEAKEQAREAKEQTQAAKKQAQAARKQAQAAREQAKLAKEQMLTEASARAEAETRAHTEAGARAALEAQVKELEAKLARLGRRAR